MRLYEQIEKKYTSFFKIFFLSTRKKYTSFLKNFFLSTNKKMVYTIESESNDTCSTAKQIYSFIRETKKLIQQRNKETHLIGGNESGY